MLHTVNGLVSTDQKTTLQTPIGPLDALLVKGSPTAGSLGRLIRDYNLIFTWSYESYDTPMLINASGEELVVRVASDCPVLTAAAALKQTNVEGAPSIARAGHDDPGDGRAVAPHRSEDILHNETINVGTGGWAIHQDLMNRSRLEFSGHADGSDPSQQILGEI